MYPHSPDRPPLRKSPGVLLLITQSPPRRQAQICNLTDRDTPSGITPADASRITLKVTNAICKTARGGQYLQKSRCLDSRGSFHTTLNFTNIICQTVRGWQYLSEIQMAGFQGKTSCISHTATLDYLAKPQRCSRAVFIAQILFYNPINCVYVYLFMYIYPFNIKQLSS